MDGAHVVASRDDRLPPTAGNHVFHYARRERRGVGGAEGVLLLVLAVPGEAADKAIRRAPILVRASSPPRSSTAREPQAPAGIKPPGSRTSRKPTRTGGLPAGAASPARPCTPPRARRLANQRARRSRAAGRQAGTTCTRIRTHDDATAAV